jgi:hypothetical protein
MPKVTQKDILKKYKSFAKMYSHWDFVRVFSRKGIVFFAIASSNTEDHWTSGVLGKTYIAKICFNLKGNDYHLFVESNYDWVKNTPIREIKQSIVKMVLQYINDGGCQCPK